MAAMTRARAAELLAELAAGDTSEYGEALSVAIGALTPKARKAKPKVNRHVAAFLKIRFPVEGGTAPWINWGELREADARLSPEAAVHFAYGRRERRADDKAVLYAAGLAGAA